MSEQEKIGLCKIQYHDQCHVKFLVDEKTGRAIEPGGDVEESPMQPWHTITGCLRQKEYLDYVFSPARLNFPMKSVGARGEGKWQQLSWDQALDEIADKLREIRDKHGAEALAILTGFYNHQWDVARFSNLYGTPNVDSVNARVCGGLEAWINYVIYGGCAHYGPPDPKHCNLLVLWANQPLDRYPIKWESMKKIRKRIIIDPRYVRECKDADIWLQPRPGTDTAVALGWLNVIINEGLYDKEFVEKWTVGFDKLKERVQKYPPKKVEEITWVPAQKIIDAARLYATTKPAAIIWGSPTGYSGLNVADTERARCYLRAITGNLGVIGGNHFNKSYKKQVRLHELELEDKLPEEQVRKAIGSDRFKVMTWPGYYSVPEEAKFQNRAFINRGAPVVALMNAIRTDKPNPIKGLIVTAANIMGTISQSKHVHEALKRVPFYACIETVWTPTAMLADYVLPACDWTEQVQIGFLEHKNYLNLGEQVFPKSVPGKYDRRDDYDIWKGLGERLGQKGHWPWKSLEEACDYRVKATGKSLKDLFMKREIWLSDPLEDRPYLKTGFLTPSGKVEFASSVFERLGYDPVADFEEPPESSIRTPDLAKKYPLIMCSTKCNEFRHSSHRNVESLRKRHPDPIVQIHPETAKKYGIAEGDWVWIENDRGKIKQKCKYFDGIDPRVIHCEFGWWFPEKPAEEPSLFGIFESNVNVLSCDSLDYASQSSGAWHLSVVQVKISKVE